MHIMLRPKCGQGCVQNEDKRIRCDACPLFCARACPREGAKSKREPDALRRPRRRRPFIKAVRRQTGEPPEHAFSASAREAQAGLPEGLLTLTQTGVCVWWYLLGVDLEKVTTDFHIVTNQQGFFGIF